jgi:hypothetical protein
MFKCAEEYTYITIKMKKKEEKMIMLQNKVKRGRIQDVKLQTYIEKRKKEVHFEDNW